MEAFSKLPLTIRLPNWAINSLAFIIAVWIAFSLLMSIVNHLENNKASRWKHPIEHTNPLEQ
jgi:hypothetical protein